MQKTGARTNGQRHRKNRSCGLTSVSIVGIGAVMGLMAVMKEVVHINNNGLIIAFSLLVFLTFLGVDSVIIWLLLRPRRDARTYFRAQLEGTHY